jgi:uncharacterized damage-inducible protein DinB
MPRFLIDLELPFLPALSSGAMSEPITDHFRRLFAYEQDSHAKVLAALQAVPEERRGQGEFQKALDLLAHVAAARRLWLGRLGVAPAATGGIEPKGMKLSELPARLSEMHGLWSRYLAGLRDGDWQRTVEYQSLDAGRFRNTLGEILTQLYGHSLYHRGQIALQLRALGCAPPVTDFIYWARVGLS